MGVTGPIPKREAQVIRRNVKDVPVETVTAIGVVRIPELGIDFPHPMVTDLYQSLRDSAQSKFYEPSDWHYARLTLVFVNDLLNAERRSAVMLQTVNSMLTNLLMTEGDRRRVRLEIERQSDGSTPTGTVTTMADFYKQSMQRGE